MNEAKYLSLSASTLSRFLSSSSFNSLPQIQSLVHQLLAKLSSYHKAFLIADTTLLRKIRFKDRGSQKAL